jgi:uncharacterized RDD family membrane protein YckC
MAENILFCSQCGSQNAASATFCQKCGANLGPSLSAAPVTYPRAVSSAGYGGFWIRFLALIVDGIIVRVAVFPFAAVLGLMGLRHRAFFIGGRLDEHDIPAMVGAALATFWIFAAINWLYEALLTSSAWQGTVGKKILSLKVTDEAGNRISFARATGRHFAKYYLSTILLVGFIMAAFTDRKRALHDMIAATLVRKV